MKLLVVYSSVTGNTRKVAEAIARAVPGSAAVVPPAMGLVIAGEVLRALGGV